MSGAASVRGFERVLHSGAASVCGCGWRVLRANAEAFWCGERVRWHAVPASECCGEQVQHAGVESVAAFGCDIAG